MTKDDLVVCCRCKATFKPMFDSQASGCSADVGLNGISGHYGSAVADLHILRYPGGVMPQDITLGAQVCDDCLTDMLDKCELLTPESRISKDPLANYPSVDRFEDFDPETAEKLLDALEETLTSGETS